MMRPPPTASHARLPAGNGDRCEHTSVLRKATAGDGERSRLYLRQTNRSFESVLVPLVSNRRQAFFRHTTMTRFLVDLPPEPHVENSACNTHCWLLSSFDLRTPCFPIFGFFSSFLPDWRPYGYTALPAGAPSTAYCLPRFTCKEVLLNIFATRGAHIMSCTFSKHGRM